MSDPREPHRIGMFWRFIHLNKEQELVFALLIALPQLVNPAQHPSSGFDSKTPTKNKDVEQHNSSLHRVLYSRQNLQTYRPDCPLRYSPNLLDNSVSSLSALLAINDVS